MPYQQLIALLPCHSLDDFPFHLEGAAADEILAAYTVLWHPSLIAEARAVPTWRRNDSDGEISWDEALVALRQRVVQTLTPSWSAIFLPLVFVIY